MTVIVIVWHIQCIHLLCCSLISKSLKLIFSLITGSIKTPYWQSKIWMTEWFLGAETPLGRRPRNPKYFWVWRDKLCTPGFVNLLPVSSTDPLQICQAGWEQLVDRGRRVNLKPTLGFWALWSRFSFRKYVHFDLFKLISHWNTVPQHVAAIPGLIGCHTVQTWFYHTRKSCFLPSDPPLGAFLFLWQSKGFRPVRSVECCSDLWKILLTPHRISGV